MDALGAPCLLLKTGRKRRERVQRARLSLLEYSKTKPVLGRLQPLDRARAESAKELERTTGLPPAAGNRRGFDSKRKQA